MLAELFNMCLKESCFADCWRVSLAIPIFRNVGERSSANNYRPLDSFLWLVKSLKKIRVLLITYGNVTFLLISSVVLGLLDQLQIF